MQIKSKMQKALEALKLRNVKAKAKAKAAPVKKTGSLTLKAILFIPAEKKETPKRLDLPKPKPKSRVVDGIALETTKVNLVMQTPIRKNYTII
jgi:hypothetical protein